MSETWVTILQGGLVASTIMAASTAYVSIRKSRREDRAADSTAEKNEADLIDTFRSMMVQELKAAAKDKEEMRSELDAVRSQVRRHEAEGFRAREMLRESASYINSLLVHIAQISQPESPNIPEMPRKLKAWMDDPR